MVNAPQPLPASGASFWRGLANIAGKAVWYLPGQFSLVRYLGSDYWLRSVVFHDISDTENSFTKGLRGTITRQDFESALRYITGHYDPVSLQQVISGQPLPPRPMLVTFDDAYASVVEFALPLCRSLSVPSVFFVNGSCLDNRQLGLDNLVCYVVNRCGIDAVNLAICSACGTGDPALKSLSDVFDRFLPSISLGRRRVFRNTLIELAKVNELELAGDAGLYLTSQQLKEALRFNCEVGDHTFSHVNCRVLSPMEIRSEVDQNRSLLETVTGRRIRSFSVPYGSSADLSDELMNYLENSGYEVVFLAQSRPNLGDTSSRRLDRVSLRSAGDAALFAQVELLPRLRALRNSFRAV